MLMGISKQAKREKLREMRFTLKQHKVKFRNEPFHVEREYKRLMAKLDAQQQ